jgi:adenosylcobinamide-GDP ribazoletransferase
VIFIIIGKSTFLSSLPHGQIWRWLIVAHTASRWTILPLCMWSPYARAEGQGKLVAKRVGILEIIIGTVMLLLVLILLPWQAAFAALLATCIVTLLSGSYFRARIQGITGRLPGRDESDH